MPNRLKLVDKQRIQDCVSPSSTINYQFNYQLFTMSMENFLSTIYILGVCRVYYGHLQTTTLAVALPWYYRWVPAGYDN